jgi:colanic acid/amylovoran biosynthesis glycosyltransferase
VLIYTFAEHYPNPYKPYIDTELAYFLRRGHDVTIFAAGQFISTVHPRVKAYGLDKRTHLFPTTLKTLPRFFPKLLAKCLLSPHKALKKIVAIYDGNDTLKLNVLRVARMLMLPDTPPDLCYIHNLATAAMIDFVHLLYPDSRIVMYFHGGEVGGVKRVERGRQLFGPMHAVFTNTRFSRDQAIQRGCPPDRIMLVPVGFDLADYPQNFQKKYRRDGVLRVISVGRLSEEKGLTFALDAIALLVSSGHRQIHYTIVGSGVPAYESYLKEHAKEIGVGAYVEFVGEKDKPGVVSLLQDSDVLILPSIVTDTWAENQGCVIQEAMFMRLLIIATRTGGVQESTAKEMERFSVPQADAPAIADAIREIASLSTEEMASLGQAGREFALKKYDIEVTGAKLERLAMLEHGGNGFQPLKSPRS